MQHLTQFADFQLNTQETQNINGGSRFKSSDLRGGTSRFRTLGRRYGKLNTVSLSEQGNLGSLTDYASYDGGGYNDLVVEQNTEVLTGSDVSTGQDPHFVIL